jgi:hypothetical protein
VLLKYFLPQRRAEKERHKAKRTLQGRCKYRCDAVLLIFFFSCLIFAQTGMSFARDVLVSGSPEVALQAKYMALRDRLDQNEFQRPLSLDSSETDGELRGEIHAVLDFPFRETALALRGTHAWCDILNLHLNVKYCRARTKKTANSLSLSVGRKHEQPLDKASTVDLTFHADATNPDYLRIVLQAVNGPLDTRDYRIVLEAIPLERQRTFIRLSYSYETSLMARLAMQCYFSTLGRDKVGFTVTGRTDDGRPIYTREMRGVIERNTMRYYLAIEAYLGTMAIPEDRRLDIRLNNWFAATERYPLQLHEMDRATYLKMKRREYERQIAVP